MSIPALSLPQLLERRPAYLPLGMLYLLLADFWLIKLAGFGLWPAFAVFAVFLWAYAAAGEKPYLLQLDRPLALVVGLFLALFFLNAFIGRGESGMEVLIRYIVLVSYLITGFAVCREIGLRNLLLLVALPYILRAVMALPTLLANSGGVASVSEQMLRMANASDGEAILSSGEFLVGIGSYTLYAAMALLCPVLAGLALQSRGKRRRYLLLALLPLSANILLSGYLLPIVLLMAGLGLLVLLRLRPTLGTLLLIVAVAAGGFGLVQLLTFIPIVQTMYDKALMVWELVTAGGVSMDPTGRGYLAQISINTFSRYPLFGAGPHEFGPFPFQTIGGHSALLDWLAQYGIIAVLFFWMVLREAGRGATTLRLRGRIELSRGIRAFQIALVIACLLNPLFLKESLDLVIFAILGGLASVNQEREAIV